MITFDEPAMALTGLPGPHRLEDLLFQAKKASRIAPVQVLRADVVVSPEHLRSAWWHAERAIAEGRNHADRPEVEFTRYAAGERQIKRAMTKLGLPDPPGDVVLAALGPKGKDAVRYFVEGLGLRTDDALLDGGAAALDRFGITAAAREATQPERVLDLVLEQVAMVDLMRK